MGNFKKEKKVGLLKSKKQKQSKVLAPEATVVEEQKKEVGQENIEVNSFKMKRFLNDQIAIPCIRNICHVALSDSFSLEVRYCDFFFVDENIYVDDAGQDEDRLKLLVEKRSMLRKLKQDKNYFIYFKGELYGMDNGDC